MAEKRGNCWSAARQKHAAFKDDLEELGCGGAGGGESAALLPVLKTHLDDVLTVRLALH